MLECELQDVIYVLCLSSINSKKDREVAELIVMI